MPQAVWTGTITFGLVSIPVKLYPATEPKDVRFHLYDRRTGRRVRYERVTRPDEPAVFAPPLGMPDEPEERPIERAVGASAPPSLPVEHEDERRVDVSEIVRGFQLPAGDLVTVSDRELAEVAPERSRTIEIEEFVDLAQIDPVFFEKSYYVAPGRELGADKPYALLQRAMRSANMVAIGRFVLRTKPHLVAIRSLERALALETLFFGDEVRDPVEAVGGLPEVTVSERELKTAHQLIRALAADWVPEKHADVYREELLGLLRRKTPVAPAEPVEAATIASVDDLMAQLKASVEAAKRRGTGASRRSTARPSRRRNAG